MTAILPLLLSGAVSAIVALEPGSVSSSAVSASLLMANMQDAGAQRISCRTIDGVPTTVSETGGKTIPLIRWISSEMAASGYAPQKRCEIVSAKFETYRSQGSLQYITTGRENGLPVICVAQSRGGPCVGTLYTLKKGQDPVRTLQKLFHLRRGASGPILESGGDARPYLSFDELIATP